MMPVWPRGSSPARYRVRAHTVWLVVSVASVDRHSNHAADHHPAAARRPAQAAKGQRHFRFQQ